MVEISAALVKYVKKQEPIVEIFSFIVHDGATVCSQAQAGGLQECKACNCLKQPRCPC